MAKSKQDQGAGGTGSFLETKGGPILYILVAVIGLWFLVWFANYKG